MGNGAGTKVAARRRVNTGTVPAISLAAWPAWLLVLALALALTAGCATGRRPQVDAVTGAGGVQAGEDDRSALEERWGVKVLSIGLSAGGYMLDFRYRVTDPQKALPLFDRRVKPFLVDEATGVTMVVPEPPKVGALRSTRPPQPERNYFMMFANPGAFLKKGGKVTVVIGDFRAERLVVQ